MWTYPSPTTTDRPYRRGKPPATTRPLTPSVQPCGAIREGERSTGVLYRTTRAFALRPDWMRSEKLLDAPDRTLVALSLPLPAVPVATASREPPGLGSGARPKGICQLCARLPQLALTL